MMQTQIPALSDFDYDLPEGLIAQEPLQDRPQARLLTLDLKTAELSHAKFLDLENHLALGDVLVLNDTKVLPARLLGERPTGGKVEVFLHKQLSANEWEALVKPGGRVRKETVLQLGQEGMELAAEVLDAPRIGSGLRHIRFTAPGDLEEALEELGRMPLPPYIDRPALPMDKELYQTVFARSPGAVASPTAGLHFNEAQLDRLRNKGIQILYVTLHVGYGTFQPVNEENLENHHMHSEEFVVSEQTALALNQALRDQRRIIACGTTVMRTLETLAAGQKEGEVQIQPGRRHTNLFIYSPYDFKIVKGLITNFHLPRTTLLMLVSAFAGHDNLMKMYREAIDKKYRFYSYGDATLIL